MREMFRRRVIKYAHEKAGGRYERGTKEEKQRNKYQWVRGGTKREEGKSSDNSEDGLKRPTKQSEESKQHGKFQRKESRPGE